MQIKMLTFGTDIVQNIFTKLEEKRHLKSPSVVRLIVL